MILKRRCYVTLMELVIAMTLIVMLLSTLSFFYRQVSWVDRTIDTIQERQFSDLLLQARLNHVLNQAVSPTQAKQDFFFFTTESLVGITQGPSLLFVYDNGVSLDKEFSNICLGRIFLDTEKRLVVMSWPAPSRWKKENEPPFKKEILMEGIDQLGFEFFAANNSGQNIPSRFWVDRWKKEYRTLPTLVKMHLKKGEETVVLSYALLNADLTVRMAP